MQNKTISIKGRVFSALVAESEAEQQQGLMGIPWPPPVMIFPYSTASVHKFWMNKTISPLDIIFCKEGKVIDLCSGEPLSTALIGPNTASDLVVELPAGTAQSIGLKVGDYIGFGG